MALIKCKECGQMVSDKAAACPNCGVTLNEGVVKYKQDSANLVNSRESQEMNWVLLVLSILIPVLGIILYFVEKDKNRQLAKYCLICGIVVTLLEGIWFVSWQVHVYRAEKAVERVYKDATDQYKKEIDKASKQMQRELDKLKKYGY